LNNKQEQVKQIIQSAMIYGYNTRYTGETWEQEDGSVKLPNQLILIDTLLVCQLFEEVTCHA
jgi:hypothetical protein